MFRVDSERSPTIKGTKPAGKGTHVKETEIESFMQNVAVKQEAREEENVDPKMLSIPVAG